MSVGYRPPGPVLCARRMELDVGLESPSQARRLLREALATVERTGWVDSGELAVSEVVTNAALHAHSRIDLTIEVFDELVCVQVRDFNPAPPIPRAYDEEATTGRGMALVAALAVECGVEMLGDEGKIVWFCVGDERVVDEVDLLAAWDIDDWTVPSPAPDRRLVTLHGMPVTLWLSARQHHDAILRELALFAASRVDCDPDLASADAARSTISGTLIAHLQDAERRGVRHEAAPTIAGATPTHAEVVDLDLVVPVDSAGLFIAMQDVLDLGERLAMEGELLTRPGLPEIVAVRDWACEQVVAQLAGVPATPWGGVAQGRFETEVRGRFDSTPVWDSSLVSEAAGCAAAADEANRLVAVSRPLAELVGRTPEELVGRRVISLIPPRFREAHVAGFTRLLTTGQPQVLGLELEVPFLCADGSERPCRMVLHEESTPRGMVYVAEIDPIVEG